MAYPLEAQWGKKCFLGTCTRCTAKFGAFALFVALSVASSVFAAPKPRANVLVTSPLLGKLVREIGGDAVQPYPIWGADGVPGQSKPDEVITGLHATKLALFVGYGTDPFTSIENTATRMLPRDTRVVVIGSDKVQGRPARLGEMVLDPLWSISAAGVIATELARELPDLRDEIGANARKFQGKMLRLTYGEKYATEAEAKGLLDAGSGARLGQWIANLGSAAGSVCLVERLAGYQGVSVADEWGVCGAFCTRFGLKYSPLSHAEKGTEVPQQLVVRWMAKDGVAAEEDWRIVRVTIDPSLLQGKDRDVSEVIAGLMDAIEPGVVKCKVRELVRSASVEPTAALALDRRAVPELLDTLSRTDRAGYWRNTVWLLGYVGDSRGFQPLKDLSTQRFADTEVTADVEKAILSVPKAMGLLAARDNRDALRFLEGSCSVAFWSDKVTWRGTLLWRDVDIVSLAENSIMGLGISGQKDVTWLNEIIRKRDPSLVHSWAAFLETDMFLWWHEKYGTKQFLSEWRTGIGATRQNEYWKSERATKMKAAVVPPGTKLPDELPQ